MKKPSPFSKRATIFLLTFVIGSLCLFVFQMFPRSNNGTVSTLSIEWLPRGEWGIGYYLRENGLSYEPAHRFGPILVKRRYYRNR
ncbi:MAG: hypothetical protein JWL77_4162 [Chthonomonadaceae bacterium]|nr:hypothetical protein [Chthonomonadaceae bacterium]